MGRALLAVVLLVACSGADACPEPLVLDSNLSHWRARVPIDECGYGRVSIGDTDCHFVSSSEPRETDEGCTYTDRYRCPGGRNAVVSARSDWERIVITGPDCRTEIEWRLVE